MYQSRQLTAMTNDELMQRAPAILAEHAAERVSAKYQQVKTLEVIDILRNQGWMPVKARSVAARSAGRLEYCKHEVRFQQADSLALSNVGDEAIQMVLVNSHDAGCAYRVMLGVYRLACSNGLTVSTSTMQDIRIRHIGFKAEQVIEASARIADAGHMITDRIDRMKHLELAPSEGEALAKAASSLVFDQADTESGKVIVETNRLLRPKRYDDQGNDLWTVFNRIQENTTKGGIRFLRRDEAGYPNRATTTAIRSIDRDIKTNQALWILAEEMLKIKTGTL